MTDLTQALDEIAGRDRFSGVVRADVSGHTQVERAYGAADRGTGRGNTASTRFGIASVTKGLTALTVMSLVEDGTLALSTPARSLLGDDLVLVPDDVTIEHLLAHRSGIGDYVDEEAIEDVTEFVLPVPVTELGDTEAYLRVLDGHPPTFRPGERFAYNNAGYVLLALLAERSTGHGFPDLVTERVCVPSGMARTGFLRTDELPPDAAVGYLGTDGDRTNDRCLPVRGSGDGGCYSTVADLHALWAALDAGELLAAGTRAEVLRPRGRDSSGSRYGLGFWLAPEGDRRWLEGYDAGVSAITSHDPIRRVTWTVLSNTTEGAWPLARHLRDTLGA